jgi:hypothetical protein
MINLTGDLILLNPNNSVEETDIRPKRPQTARTKKKLRTQEEIDKEARESINLTGDLILLNPFLTY